MVHTRSEVQAAHETVEAHIRRLEREREDAVSGGRLGRRDYIDIDLRKWRNVLAVIAEIGQ